MFYFFYDFFSLVREDFFLSMDRKLELQWGAFVSKLLKSQLNTCFSHLQM